MNYDREKLKGLCSKRIKTGFIGAVHLFEKMYCHLWGGSIDSYGEMLLPEVMNESQKKFYDTYLQFRSDVLRLGNNQIRLNAGEFNNFDVKFRGIQFFFKETDNG